MITPVTRQEQKEEGIKPVSGIRPLQKEVQEVEEIKDEGIDPVTPDNVDDAPRRRVEFTVPKVGVKQAASESLKEDYNTGRRDVAKHKPHSLRTLSSSIRAFMSDRKYGVGARALESVERLDHSVLSTTIDGIVDETTDIPKNHRVHAWHTMNILVNNSVFDEERVSNFLDMLRANPNRLFSVYDKNERLLNDIEITFVTMSTDDMVLVSKSIDSKGQCVAHDLSYRVANE